MITVSSMKMSLSPAPLLSLVGLLALAGQLEAQTAESSAGFPNPADTQALLIPLPSPQESVSKIKLPPGFKVTLYAGEPDVRNPIAMAFDRQGRLWIAENYTYTGSGNYFDTALKDRILIFEDADNDGRFDKRTVFWDGAERLTAIEVGFGGVYALCAPNLVFIPFEEGSDKPGKPVVLLDGWNASGIAHNVVNGLRWGPDGWLYGRHGILAHSLVGQPGATDAERVRLNCGIWRFHPVRKKFEVVAHGTTNPWGLDFDQYGQGFFINTVIGHLWHLIPGAHYRRMYGEDLNPHVYELIDQHADHFHWDATKLWTDSREAKGVHSDFGGGHAHSGLMIYLEDNWPADYRGSLFTVNLHGRRLNRDRLVSSGSGYIGRHEPDFMAFNEPWFRAIELGSGPDGGVFVIDWTDIGECHESDGVHRGSGRIYKVTYGDPPKPEYPDFSKPIRSSNGEAGDRLEEWAHRQNRLRLQELAAQGQDMSRTIAELERQFRGAGAALPRVRALWKLHSAGGLTEKKLASLLSHPDEPLRIWAIRFLLESASSPEALASTLAQHVRREQSAAVRLQYASALQSLPPGSRYEVAASLVSRPEDAKDHNLPLMIWYGIEPMSISAVAPFRELAQISRIPLITRLVTRRLGEEIRSQPGLIAPLIRYATESQSESFAREFLSGLSEALRGVRKLPKPAGWGQFLEWVRSKPSKELSDKARELSLVFGDGRALDELKAVASAGTADLPSRRAAIDALIETRDESLVPFLRGLAAHRDVSPYAVRGLISLGAIQFADLILNQYRTFRPPDKPPVISEMVSRPAFADLLLESMKTGKIPRTDLTAFQARQIKSHDNPNLNEKLAETWGLIQSTSEEHKKQIARLKLNLTDESLRKADSKNGHALFTKLCATCHKLHGAGADIGPDLTGAGRDNLDYLLENMIDPSAVVGVDFRISSLKLKDGRILNGVVTSTTASQINLQTATEKLRLERADLLEIQTSSLSLMPEGLVDPLTDQEIRDLIGFLMVRPK